MSIAITILFKHKPYVWVLQVFRYLLFAKYFNTYMICRIKRLNNLSILR